ncbi:MAG: hypothetical protein Q8Q59_11905 [Luteolibacter sp.]|jgi:hypothetical protein|nr:hypothetical protein [Luteolibacter sp.]
MNSIHTTKVRPLRLQTPWAVSCALTLLVVAPASAQSAANFDAGRPPVETPSASQESKGKKSAAAPAATPAKVAGPVSTSPSRHIGETELPAYVESLTAVFSIQKRVTDPFGQLQDPNAKPIIKNPIAKAAPRFAPLQATPFSDIIRLIKVTTIMPGEKRFLIGTRSVRQGDRIPITFRGKNLNVEVSSVSARRIEFRNLENGESAALPLTLLPVGMTPGNHGISAPGMVPDLPNAPIDLDGGISSNDTFQNR